MSSRPPKSEPVLIPKEWRTTVCGILRNRGKNIAVTQRAQHEWQMAFLDAYPWDLYGSYGINSYTLWPYWGDGRDEVMRRITDWYTQDIVPYYWSTPHVKGASNVPMQLDSSMWYSGWPRNGGEPPACDAIPTESARPTYHPPAPRSPEPDHEWGEYGETPSCINHHDGYVNGLFFDWSVRRVGLKELWTLKWHQQFNTIGPWTKSGGVRPEDWPKWMRGFKDY